MRKYLIVALFLGLVCANAFAEGRGDLDEEEQPIGTERYFIKGINLPGSVDSLKLIDLNQDGTKEVVYLIDEQNVMPDGQKQSTLYLHIFSYDNTSSEYQFRQGIKIPPSAAIITIGDYLPAKGKEIVFFTSADIFCYALSELWHQQGSQFVYAETPIKLITIADDATIFHPVEKFSPNPILKEGEDINNDGIDDLIVPTLDGYQINWGPFNGGAPAKSQIIKLAAIQTVKKSSTTFVSVSYTLPNISFHDINGDKAKDAILGYSDKLIFYFQDKNTAAFPDEPSYEFRLDFLSLNENDAGSNIMLYSSQFGDINADGVTDMIIASTSGNLSDIGNLITRFFIFIANPAVNKQTLYPPTPSQVINLKSICPLWKLTEINGDNYPDLFICSFKVSMGSNIKKAILKYIPITYQIYLNKPGKLFPVSADYERMVNFPVNAISRGTGYFSHIYLGYDMTNDNRTDLLTISGPERKKGLLAIYRGRPKEQLTNKNGVAFEKDEWLLLPLRIPDNVIIADLNNDKKNDIILQYKSRLITVITK